MQVNDDIREEGYKALQEVFAANLNYEDALSIVHACGRDTVVQELPDELRNLLFSSYQPKYSYLRVLKSSNSVDVSQCLPAGAMKGAGADWWREYGIGLIAEAILACAPITARKLNADKVKNYVAQYESVLDLFAYYAYATSFLGDTSFRSSCSRCNFITHEMMVERYAELMEGIAPIRAIWAASGMWPNMRQEIYHHGIKMTALRFTPAETDGVLARAKQAGMPIPDDLGPGVWYKCKEFCGKGRWLSAEDLLPYCRQALTECRPLPPQGWWDVRLYPIDVQEYGADVFFGKYAGQFR